MTKFTQAELSETVSTLIRQYTAKTGRPVPGLLSLDTITGAVLRTTVMRLIEHSILMVELGELLSEPDVFLTIADGVSPVFPIHIQTEIKSALQNLGKNSSNSFSLSFISNETKFPYKVTTDKIADIVYNALQNPMVRQTFAEVLRVDLSRINNVLDQKYDSDSEDTDEYGLSHSKAIH